ncbi:MAG TPA: DUF3800 domain-containing protein [Chitinophagaceae bacterium]|nr:DUF3800 domain-containing protein [Chitinophagaceae bacterium]
MQENTPPLHSYHFFLDEAGDPIFYGKGKKIIIGQQGVSSCFILGMVRFNTDLRMLADKVLELQRQVISDPWFRKVGSINKKKKNQGFYFHATDDVPEVRKLFYEFIRSLDCVFEAVVGYKIPDIFIKKHNSNEKEFYADLLSHLLNDKLELDNKIVLNVAERGASTRDENLKLGLQKAISHFNLKKPEGIVNTKVSFNVQNQTSEPLLNIADYFCWSVQRVFERGEDRYYDYLKEKIKVIDLYNIEKARTGKNIYTIDNPLTSEIKKAY